MPKRKDDTHLLELAKRGAQAQLNDLVHEMNMLLDLFPHLRDSLDADELPVSFLLKKGSQKALRPRRAKAATGPGPKKRTLSAAATKAISEAQKKRRALQKPAKKR